MTNKYPTIRIWECTLRKLRMIYALTGESMVSILERVVGAELERIQIAQNDEKQEAK